ncbi:hypothetical protein OUZ56_023280 [Daphnia magna]|uniref:Uncharacterized protein n=1 Tax=Daphnia magna TaxID=35525 RepID=A0ABR0AYV7_9CRUS|nr:hypothetical protein OUZ56_023280 [Daphnia magna]
MNDDVVTGGHKFVHSPETVARSLDFDSLTTESQFAPDTLQSGSSFWRPLPKQLTVSLAYHQIFLADIRNLTLYLRELRLLTPLEPLTPEINLLLRKLDHFPGASRPNNVQLAEGDQTNALPNQNPIETTAITGYHGTDITAIRVTTAITAAVENPELPIPVRHTVHRTGNHTTSLQIGTTFPWNNGPGGQRALLRNLDRSLTGVVPAHSQNSQQGNLRFRLLVQNKPK